MLGRFAYAEPDAADKPAPRLYRNGPLVAEDFKAKPDETKPKFSAWTETDFDYHYGYEFARRGGQWIVTLTKIEVHAFLLQDKSWNKRPTSATLMDHEQGHFDIMQLYALRAQTKLHADLDTADVLEGRNANKGDAIRALEKDLLAVLQQFMDEAIAANKKYDEDTANGANFAKQANLRREQKLHLQEAADAWLKLTEE